FTSRRRHTRWPRDWSSDVCSSDLIDVYQCNATLGKSGPQYMTQDKRRALGRGLETLLPASQVVGGREAGSRQDGAQGTAAQAAAVQTGAAAAAVAIKMADGELR